MLDVIALDMLALITLLSLLAGAGSYLQLIREERIKRGALELITELTLALTVGLCVGYWASYKEWHNALTCVVVILSANNGGDVLYKCKAALSQFIERRLGVDFSKDKEK